MRSPGSSKHRTHQLRGPPALNSAPRLATRTPKRDISTAQHSTAPLPHTLRHTLLKGRTHSATVPSIPRLRVQARSLGRKWRFHTWRLPPPTTASTIHSMKAHLKRREGKIEKLPRGTSRLAAPCPPFPPFPSIRSSDCKVPCPSAVTAKCINQRSRETLQRGLCLAALLPLVEVG